MPSSGRRGRIVVDLQALQSSSTRDRGIGHYTLGWALALEELDSELVSSYVLNPDLLPPGRIDALAETGKVAYRSDVDLAGIGLWHSLAPFDLSVPTSAVAPQELFRSGLRFSATVYDLIPALDPDRELADARLRRHYRTRLELVRSADAVLTISEAVAGDLKRLARLEDERVFLVGAAPDARFVPPADRARAASEAIELLGPFGLTRPFVLAPSGSHPRKNNEVLVRAFCSLPASTLEQYQLVITGEYDEPTRHHYLHLAELASAVGAVVVPGHVEESELLTLVQGAELVCVPELAAGFGLPIVEAQACRTPVICSDRAPFDELVEAEGRFDPTEVGAISQSLEHCLGDEALRARLGAVVPKPWRAVAERSAESFTAALTRPARWSRSSPSLRRRRPRVAFVTPLPPAPSGVAGYSYSLIDALVRTEKAEIDVFVEGRCDETLAPDGVELHSVQALGKVEQLSGSYDQVVYTLGNSHHHLGALGWLRRRPGVVLAHDVRLSNLYRHEHGDPGLLSGGLARAVQEMYPGGMPDEVGQSGEVTEGEIERFGVLMSREVIGSSTAFLVSSSSAASLARLDAGAELASRIEVLPFAFNSPSGSAPGYVEEPRPAPEGLQGRLDSAWGRAASKRDGPLIASFGIVDPQKRPELLLDALALLVASGGRARLAFVGPISDTLAASLASRVDELDLVDHVLFTGPLPPAPYRSWLESADLAVQLRARSNGEASAAIGECLGAGLATIVSDLGWSGELPDDAVAKLAVNAKPEHLAWQLSLLLADDSARALLGLRARRFAEEQTFAKSARTLLSLLDRV